jgi:hypothetical protein
MAENKRANRGAQTPRPTLQNFTGMPSGPYQNADALVQGGEHCPHRHRGNARSPRVQGWDTFKSASLLFSGYGLQDSILTEEVAAAVETAA